MSFQSGLHLGTTILEPKLHLPSLQAKPFAEFQPLLFIRMKTLLEQGFKLLDLLSVPVVSLLSWWVVDNILIIPKSTVHVISSRSALMLIFSLKLAASSSYNSLSLSKPPHIPPSRDQSHKRRRKSCSCPQGRNRERKKKKANLWSLISDVNLWAMNRG